MDSYKQHLVDHSCLYCLYACSALEHFKRWLIPEKVAISAEELEYLLRPSQTKEQAGGDPSHSGAEEEEQEDRVEVDESASPEK